MKQMLKDHRGGAGAVFLAAMIALFLSGVPCRRPAAEATRAYDVYMGFSAKRECVPEKGPFLTELSWDIHIANVRFVFRKQDVFGQQVNWFPLYGGAPESSIPLLVHFFPGQIDAKLCAFNKCNEKIERAWFKKQDRAIQAVLSIVPVEDIAELRREALEPESLKPLARAVAPILPCLLQGKRLDIEFPFTSDAIDSQGTLSLRFIPAGTPIVVMQIRS